MVRRIPLDLWLENAKYNKYSRKTDTKNTLQDLLYMPLKKIAKPENELQAALLCNLYDLPPDIRGEICLKDMLFLMVREAQIHHQRVTARTLSASIRLGCILYSRIEEQKVEKRKE